MDNDDLFRLQDIYNILCDLIYKHDGSYWTDWDSCNVASLSLHEARNCIRDVCSAMFPCLLIEVE